MEKELLKEIGQIIQRINYENDFLEDPLQLKLQSVLFSPADFPSSNYNQLKQLLFMISGMEKSSNFGYFYYETLHENSYPFCEEVLKSAVFHEKYYNLNDKALKSYVRSYLINKNIDAQLILLFDKIIPEGHGSHFFDSFSEIEQSSFDLDLYVNPGFFDVLYTVINNDFFPMSQKKAAVIIAFLKIQSLVPSMIGKAYQLLNLEKQNSENVLVLTHLLKSISITRHEGLPKDIESKILQIISSRSNGALPLFFDPMKAQFSDYINSLKNISQLA